MYDEEEVRELVMEWFQVREIVVDVAPEEIMDQHELIRAVTTHINMTLLKTKKTKKEGSYGHKHPPQHMRNPRSNVPTQSTTEQQEELVTLIMAAEEAHKNPQSMVEHAIKTFNVSGIDQFNTTQADSLIKSLRNL